MRIRQIALVAKDLEPIAEALCDCLGLEIAFRDPGIDVFGLKNVLLPIGKTFLEVVSPTQDGTSAGRLLDRRSGDGGYMVILQSDDLAKDRARMAELGVRIVWEAELEDIATIHLHPKHVGGAILSLDVAEPRDSWRWAGPDWADHAHTDRVSAIRGAEIQSGDPEALATRWGAVVDAPVSRLADDSFEIELEEAGRLRFVPLGDDRGEGLAGLTLLANDPEAVLESAAARGLPVADSTFEIAGMRVRLTR